MGNKMNYAWYALDAMGKGMKYSSARIINSFQLEIKLLINLSIPENSHDNL